MAPRVRDGCEGRPSIDEVASPRLSMGALLRAGHPGPSLAITIMIVLLTFADRPGVAILSVFAFGVLAGEFSIGWCNDYFDAATDAASGRTDKPIVVGQIDRRSVGIAGVVALLVGIVACFAVSAETGVLNVVMMAAGWAYNAGLKGTLYSGVMYVVGFSLIPAFAASAQPGQGWPPVWLTAAAALLGLGGHFANVLPDLAADRAGGVQGLPQRIAATRGGGVTVRLICLALLLGASVLLVLAPGGVLHWYQLAGLGAAGLLGVVGAVATGRTPFFAAIAIAALDVVLFLTRI